MSLSIPKLFEMPATMYVYVMSSPNLYVKNIAGGVEHNTERSCYYLLLKKRELNRRYFNFKSSTNEIFCNDDN